MLRLAFKPISWSRAVFTLRTAALCSTKTRTNKVTGFYGESISPGNIGMLAATPQHFSTSDRQYSTTRNEMTEAEYEEIADETLDSLTEMFEDLPERFDLDPDYDITFNSGVLTVKISNDWGTYVINKQTPNKQIWFSSPKSGPKRYDFDDGVWIYKHDNGMLHELLNTEISKAIGHDVDFKICSFGQKE